MSTKDVASAILNAFSTIDVDNSGEVDADELVAAGFSKADVDAVIKAVDVDGDGKLSKEELEAFVKG